MSYLHKDLKDGVDIENMTNFLNAKKILKDLFQEYGKKDEKDTKGFDLFTYQLLYNFIIGNVNEEESKRVIKFIQNEKDQNHISINDALQLIEVGTEMSKKEKEIKNEENSFKQYYNSLTNVTTTNSNNAKTTYPYCGKEYEVLNENNEIH